MSVAALDAPQGHAPPRARAALFAFPVAVTTPRWARWRTVEFARRCGLDALCDVAELLVSELMTNAYEASLSPPAHRRAGRARGRAALQLRLAAEDGRLRIEVRDRDPRPPVPRRSRPDREGGWGLRLVERFSERWGYDRLPEGGKAVWCVVASLPASGRAEGRLRGAGPRTRPSVDPAAMGDGATADSASG